MITQIQTCKDAPNIFKYATKELSQDAVICWLVACAKEATGELRDCGMSFVRALLRSGGSRFINARSGESEILTNGNVTEIVGGVYPKYSKINVIFQVKWAGKLVSFVVEDKTKSEAHSGQLNRYRRTVESEKIEEDYIKLIYFKSGYVYEDEREKAKNAGYCVIDANDVLNFFQNGMWSTTHVFIRDFAKHVKDGEEDRRKKIDSWDLNKEFVQWEFMVKLASALELADEGWPKRSVNNGVGATTAYPRYSVHKTLFWRLDPGDLPRFQLKVYPRKVGNELALASWYCWEKTFRNAANDCGLKTIELRKRRKFKGKLVSQGTIGAVDVRNCLKQEDLEECVKRVCELHKQFVKSTGLQF